MTRGPQVRALFLVPLIGCAFAIVAGDATADATPASLRGETVESRLSRSSTTTGCDSGTDGTFTFDVSGRARGPYSGTFVADGSVTLANNTITAIKLHLTIASGSTRVRVRRVSLTHKSPGFCVPDYGLASVTYRYKAVALRGGKVGRRFKGSGTLAASGGSMDASQLFANFG